MNLNKVLNQPVIYDLFKYLISPSNLTKYLVDEYIRPFPDAEILDIGCGTGTIRPYLPATIHYSGIDINPEYIQSAQKNLIGRDRFICGDITSLGDMKLPENNYDIILALGLIHHLDDTQSLKVIHDALNLLKKGGFLITLDGVYEPRQSWAARIILSHDRGQYVRTHEEYLALAMSDGVHVESYVRDDLLRIPYSHCIMRVMKS